MNDKRYTIVIKVARGPNFATRSDPRPQASPKPQDTDS